MSAPAPIGDVAYFVLSSLLGRWLSWLTRDSGGNALVRSLLVVFRALNRRLLLDLSFHAVLAAARAGTDCVHIDIIVWS